MTLSFFNRYVCQLDQNPLHRPQYILFVIHLVEKGVQHVLESVSAMHANSLSQSQVLEPWMVFNGCNLETIHPTVLGSTRMQLQWWPAQASLCSVYSKYGSWLLQSCFRHQWSHFLSDNVYGTHSFSLQASPGFPRKRYWWKKNAVWTQLHFSSFNL